MVEPLEIRPINLSGAQYADVHAMACRGRNGAWIGRKADMPVSGAGGVDHNGEAGPFRRAPHRPFGEGGAADITETDK